MLYVLDIKCLKDYLDNKDYININNSKIYIDKQKTGFGYKSFFLCPECGERRTKLYSKEAEMTNLICRSCIDTNIYKNRTDLYDEGGTELIEYKFYTFLQHINYKNALTNMHIPFDYRFYWNTKPKYMRYDKFNLILKQLTALSAMRDVIILQKYKYNVKDINKVLDKVDQLEFNQIFGSVWFHMI